MVGWYHRLTGHGFRWTLGVGDGQEGLACCGSWGRKELDMTELNHLLIQVYGLLRFFLWTAGDCTKDYWPHLLNYLDRNSKSTGLLLHLILSRKGLPHNLYPVPSY